MVLLDVTLMQIMYENKNNNNIFFYGKKNDRLCRFDFRK
jgi:hypothetical protein